MSKFIRNNTSWAKVASVKGPKPFQPAGGKRPGGTLTHPPTKEGEHNATPGVLQFLQKMGAYTKIEHSQPLSSLEHGLRIMVSDTSLESWGKMGEAFSANFPKTVLVNYKNLHRGWVDVRFMSMEEAAEAAKIKFL